MASYDSPVFQITRERVVQTTAGANGVSGKFVSFATLLLKRAQAVVITAGTSSGAGNEVLILAGTATAGSIVLGSSTAGVVSSIVDLSAAAAVAPGTPISFVNGTDATGVAVVTLEYTEQPA